MEGKPEIGMEVCDCRYHHRKITNIHEDGDTVALDDNEFSCSFYHCCDPVDHEFEHPSTIEGSLS